MKNLVLSVIGCAFLMSGCPSSNTIDSDQVVEADLVREYRILHDDERGRVESTVQFRVGTFSGDSVRLLHPSHVEVGGEEMRLRHGEDRFDSWSGTDYFFVFDQPSPQYTFLWHKTDGSTTEQVVNAPLQIRITGSPSILNIAKEISIRVDVLDIGESESINGILESAAGSISYGQYQDGRIVFPAEAIDAWSTGAGNLSVERVSIVESPAGKGPKKIREVRHYRSPHVGVTLVFEP